MRVRTQELLYLGLLLLYSCALVLVRVRLTDTIHFRFLIWNLFLAMIPLAISLLYVRVRPRLPGWLWLTTCLSFWLLFFPNAPYIATDLMHLGYHENMPKWYDPLMLLSASLTGLWAGFLSLREFEAELWDRIGRWPTRAFVALVWFLSGIGIYLGRVQRWNSWDLFRHPDRLFRDVIMPFINPTAFPRTLALIVLFSSFFWLSYLFWRSHQGSQPPEVEVP